MLIHFNICNLNLLIFLLLHCYSFYQRDPNSIFLEFLLFHFIKLLIKAEQNNTFQTILQKFIKVCTTLPEISLFYLFKMLFYLFKQMLFKESIFLNF